MKGKIIISVMAGFALGVLATWVLVLQTTGKAFNQQYLIGVMDQANVALHIRAGQQMALLNTIEPALPGYVLTINREFKDEAGSLDALWMVKAYYKRNTIAVPAEIQGIMDSLPAQPPTSCQIRLRNLEKDAANKTTDSGSPK